MLINIKYFVKLNIIILKFWKKYFNLIKIKFVGKILCFYRTDIITRHTACVILGISTSLKLSAISPSSLRDIGWYCWQLSWSTVPRITQEVCLAIESPTAHFSLYLVTLRQILRILWSCEISSIYVTYLSFDLDLYRKCHCEISIRDPSRIFL